jgi:hypothetical protein
MLAAWKDFRDFNSSTFGPILFAKLKRKSTRHSTSTQRTKNPSRKLKNIPKGQQMASARSFRRDLHICSPQPQSDALTFSTPSSIDFHSSLLPSVKLKTQTQKLSLPSRNLIKYLQLILIDARE